jgi:uncharacterized protein YuzE
MKFERHRFAVRTSTPPTIEVDTEAEAIYVRFKKGKVAKTVPRESEEMHIAVDLDSKGEVIGIEAVGMSEFTLRTILEKALVDAPEDVDYSKARYVPSSLVLAS